MGPGFLNQVPTLLVGMDRAMAVMGTALGALSTAHRVHIYIYIYRYIYIYIHTTIMEISPKPF